MDSNSACASICPVMSRHKLTSTGTPLEQTLLYTCFFDPDIFLFPAHHSISRCIAGPIEKGLCNLGLPAHPVPLTEYN